MPVATKNGTPVLIRDLGTVSFGPDIRQGVAEWNGEGEAVGGIIVMRYGMNALNVIDGVKKKLAEIKPSLPPGVEIVSGYDRSGLIQASIKTLQQVLGGIPELRSIFAERVAEGFYINVEVNRLEAARYGLTVGDVQRAVTSGIGGENIAENVESRERYPINVRYSRDFRDDISQIQRVVIATPTGAQIPISEVAKVYFSRGPACPHSKRQRRAFRFRARVMQPQQAGGVVGAPGHRHRANQAEPSAAKRPA